jgi:hypothetical protein
MSAAMVLWMGVHGIAAMAVSSAMLDGIGAERLGAIVSETTLAGLAGS